MQKEKYIKSENIITNILSQYTTKTTTSPIIKNYILYEEKIKLKN